MKCRWCGHVGTDVKEVKKPSGEILKLCSNCESAIKESKCRMCGCEVNHLYTLSGLCIGCLQVEARNRTKVEERVLAEVEAILNEDSPKGEPITEEECKQWSDKVFEGINPELLRTDGLYKNIWVISKFLEAKKTKEDVVKYSKELMYIINNDIDKVLYKRTMLITVESESDKKQLEGKVIAASHGRVYLVEY